MKAPAKDRRRIERMMKQLAKEGAELLDNDHLKFEGRFPSGLPDGSQIAVYVFRSYQTRVYGGWVELEGVRMFVCPEMDKKKTGSADQEMLKRTARKLGEIGSND